MFAENEKLMYTVLDKCQGGLYEKIYSIYVYYFSLYFWACCTKRINK